MSENLQIICPVCETANRVPAARLNASPLCGKCRHPLFSGTPLTLDQASFQRHLQRSDIPLLVDFWASWCGPCQMMAPAFEAAAARLEPQVRLGKVDTEAQQAIAGAYGIRSIPTLILFSGGKEIARQAGAMPESAMIDWVRSQLR